MIKLSEQQKKDIISFLLKFTPYVIDKILKKIARQKHYEKCICDAKKIETEI